MMRTTFLVPSAVAQAVQADQNYTWAAHASAGAGTYDGQRRRIISGVGNRPFWLEWNATDSVWDPANGEQPYYIGAVMTDNTNNVQSITLPTVAHPANFWRAGTGVKIDIMAEDSASATARSLVLTLGASTFVNLPTATNRRTGALYGFVAASSSSQWGYTKGDANAYVPYDSANTNVTQISEDLTTALNLSGSVSVTTAGVNTLTLRRYKLSLVRG